MKVLLINSSPNANGSTAATSSWEKKNLVYLKKKKAKVQILSVRKSLLMIA